MATPFRRPYVSWRVVSSIGELRGCTISGTRQHAGQAIAPIPRSSGDGPVEIQRPPISVFSRSISLYKGKISPLLDQDTVYGHPKVPFYGSVAKTLKFFYQAFLFRFLGFCLGRRLTMRHAAVVLLGNASTGGVQDSYLSSLVLSWFLIAFLCSHGVCPLFIRCSPFVRPSFVRCSRSVRKAVRTVPNSTPN